MSEFCPNCPMRGKATGPIKSSYISNEDVGYEVRAVMGRGALIEQYQGYIAVLIGSNNGVSGPFKVPGRQGVTERAKARLDTCEQPSTEDRGVFRPKLYVTGCPALGSFALNPTVALQFQNAFQEQLNAELF